MVTLLARLSPGVLCQTSSGEPIFLPPLQDMEELISKTIPENIRLMRDLKLDEPLCKLRSSTAAST